MLEHSGRPNHKPMEWQMICEELSADGFDIVKQCSNCNNFLELFNYGRLTKGILRSECKKCNAARSRETTKRYRNQEKNIPNYQKCRDCGKIKASTDFPKNITTKSGLSIYCKMCKSIRGKSSQEKIKIRSKIIPETKVCKHCNELRSSEDFGKSSYVVDGLKPYCKQCDSINSVKWGKSHPDITARRTAKRRSDKLCATPPWLTDSHLMQINWFYNAAQKMSNDTGIKHDVDHIHPLKGINFSGLHVPWNLMVVTASKNRSKNNQPPKNETELFW